LKVVNKEEHNPLDEKFHNAFSELEETPSPEVWRNVEIELDKGNKKRPAYWIWFTGTGLLLLLAGLGAWYLFNTKTTGKNAIVIKTKSTTQKQKTDTGIHATNSNIPTAASTQADLNIKKDSSKEILSKQNIIAINARKKEKHINIANKPINKKTDKVTKSTIVKTISSPTALSKDNNIQVKEVAQTQNNPLRKEEETKKALVTPTVNIPIPASKKEATTESTNVPAIAANPNGQKVRDSSMSKVSVKKTDSIKKTVSNTIQAKTDTPVVKMKVHHIFNIAGFYGPQIEKNEILSNNGNLNLNNDKPGTSFNAGIKAGLTLGSRIEVSAGISYSRFSLSSSSGSKFYFSRYLTQPYTFSGAYGDMVVPVSTMDQGFSLNAPPSVTAFIMQYQYSQTLSYVNVPIDFRLNFNLHKFKFYISTGVIVQDAVTTNATLYLIKENETDQINYSSLNISKLNFSIKGSIGIEYDITHHFGVYLEPDASRDITSYSTSEVKSITYFIGCNGGVKLYF